MAVEGRGGAPPTATPSRAGGLRTARSRHCTTRIVATSVVPEPSTWILLATGLGALGVVALRRRRDGELEIE